MCNAFESDESCERDCLDRARMVSPFSFEFPSINSYSHPDIVYVQYRIHGSQVIVSIVRDRSASPACCRSRVENEKKARSMLFSLGFNSDFCFVFITVVVQNDLSCDNLPFKSILDRGET
jgi:hypothetical protein